jgi:guanylate kinase
MKIVLVGKGASGKDYLRRRLEKRGAKYGVSHTTRAPRPGEVDGVDYFYTTREDFLQKIDEGYFMEYQEFNGWYYGLAKEEFDRCELQILNVEGLEMLPDWARAQCFVIYLDIDRQTRLERLSGRNDNNDSIERRINADDEQFDGFNDFDMKVTNPDF